MYASALLPIHTLTEIQELVETNMRHAATARRRWRDDPAYFADHCNELCVRDFGAGQDPPDQIHVLGKVIAWRHDEFLSWRNLNEVLKDLKRMGLSNISRNTSQQVKFEGQIKDAYRDVMITLTINIARQQVAFQAAFALGRGSELTVTTNVWDSFAGRLKGLMEGFSNFKLNTDYLDLKMVSHLDYMLAGLSKMSGLTSTNAEKRFSHFLLEYEQAIKTNPLILNEISAYFQQTIGSLAMSFDIFDSILAFFHSEDHIPPSSTFSERYHRLIDESMKCYMIFEEVDIPTIRRIEVEKHITPHLVNDLWKDYDDLSLRLFGQTVSKPLRLEPALEKPKPQWVREIVIQDTSFPLTDIHLSISGHTFLKTEAVTSEDKKKTRGFANVTDEVIDAQVAIPRLQIQPDPCEGSVRFQVNNKQMKLVAKLFSNAIDHEGRGQVKWVDICKARSDQISGSTDQLPLLMYFTTRVDEVGGSIVRFVPPNNAGRPFLEHRPHPGNNIGETRYRALWQRLTERYGWTVDWFQRVELDV
ncbi:hypothetical protein L486_05265 [Kwoniella mangroviensis CBS 10435]|uniref:Uncharacterized protein n=1 Tax=Kwoniella mangroviensis CBS 10435 TaxID=1331196 RepID=A0A1B9IQU0_9TREE|nr:hypothetical protein L486_05265 [Kwoniella mangroviensis CBS 10435]